MTNGQAERFVQTIKNGLRTMTNETGDLNFKLHKFLSQNRKAPNSTGDSAYQLMFGRTIRTRLDLMVDNKMKKSIVPREVKYRRKTFNPGEQVQVRNYDGINKWMFGKIVRREGNLHYLIETSDNHLIRRHINQMKGTSYRPL